jgi:hypothetical protein
VRRLFTRNGHDCSSRYPWIVESALRNRHRQFVIDGKALILGIDGIPDFNALHSRQRDEEVQLYAFDVLALNGEDLRGLPGTSATNCRPWLHGGSGYDAKVPTLHKFRTPDIADFRDWNQCTFCAPGCAPIPVRFF